MIIGENKQKHSQRPHYRRVLALSICLVAISIGWIIFSQVYSSSAKASQTSNASIVSLDDKNGITTQTDSETGQEHKIYSTGAIQKLQQSSTLSSLSTSSQSITSSYTGKISSIKNQGTYGTCWAFGTIAALETAYMNKYPTEPEPDFSEAALAVSTYTEATINNQLGGDARTQSENGCYLPISRNISTNGDELCNGGTVYSAAATLASDQTGIINEAEDPYLNTGDEESDRNTMTQKALTAYLKKQDVILSSAETYNDYMIRSYLPLTRTYLPTVIEQWKQAVRENQGACAFAFYADRELSNISVGTRQYQVRTNWCWYADTLHTDSDHIVQCFGYDDEMSRYLFAYEANDNLAIDDSISEILYINFEESDLVDADNHTMASLENKYVSKTPRTESGWKKYVVPRTDGAWKIKNSWSSYPEYGSAWSGIEYISYWDKTINSLMSYDVEKGSGSQPLQYDRCDGELVSVPGIIGANVFCPIKNFYVNRIGINALHNTEVCSYIVKIYKDLQDMKNPESGTLIDTINVTGKGYITAKLNKPFTADGKYISITIEGKDSNNNNTIPIERGAAQIAGGFAITYTHAGESFYKTSANNNWTDVMAVANDVSSIKVQGHNVSVKLLGTNNNKVSIYDSITGEKQQDIDMDATGYCSVPQAPTKSGYVFVEWNTNRAGTGKSIAPLTRTRCLASNQIIWAIWIKMTKNTAKAMGARTISVPTQYVAGARAIITYSEVYDDPSPHKTTVSAGTTAYLKNLTENSYYYINVQYTKNNYCFYKSTTSAATLSSTRQAATSKNTTLITYPNYDSKSDPVTNKYVRVKYMREASSLRPAGGWHATDWYTNKAGLAIQITGLDPGATYRYKFEYSKDKKTSNHMTQSVKAQMPIMASCRATVSRVTSASGNALSGTLAQKSTVTYYYKINCNFLAIDGASRPERVYISFGDSIANSLYFSDKSVSYAVSVPPSGNTFSTTISSNTLLPKFYSITLDYSPGYFCTGEHGTINGGMKALNWYWYVLSNGEAA